MDFVVPQEGLEPPTPSLRIRGRVREKQDLLGYFTGRLDPFIFRLLFVRL